MATHNIVVFGGDHCGPEVCFHSLLCSLLQLAQLKLPSPKGWDARLSATTALWGWELESINNGLRKKQIANEALFTIGCRRGHQGTCFNALYSHCAALRRSGYTFAIHWAPRDTRMTEDEAFRFRSRPTWTAAPKHERTLCYANPIIVGFI